MRLKFLIRALQLTFLIAMLFYITSFVFNVYMNSIWGKSPEETALPASRFKFLIRRMATIYKEDGIKIPVTMVFFYPDTVVQYAGKLDTFSKGDDKPIFNQNEIDIRKWQSGNRRKLEEWQQIFIQKYDTIYRVDTLINSALIPKQNMEGVKGKERYQQNVFELVNYQSTINSWVSVRPKLQKHCAIMLFRDNLSTFFYIFIFYLLMKIASILRSNFSVSKNLCNRLRQIGFIAISYTILQFFLDYWLKSIYSFISLENYSTLINQIDGMHLSMYPYLGFSFYIFISGVLLIILSVLMKRSSEIEDAWALTI